MGHSNDARFSVRIFVRSHIVSSSVWCVRAGEWKVLFTESGVAYLTQEQELTTQTTWANSVLADSLHEHKDGERFVHSRVARETTPIKSISLEMSPIVFWHRSASVGEFRSECYAFKLPRAQPSASVFWEVPWVQSAMWGNEVHNRWVCRNVKGWSEWLASLGIPEAEQHIRQSVKSLKAKARQEGGAMDPQEVLSGELEYSLSSIGLIALLVGWATKCVMKSGGDSQANAERVLSCILEAVVGDWTFVFSALGGVPFSIVGGMVDIAALKEQSAQLRRRLANLDDYAPICE